MKVKTQRLEESTCTCKMENWFLEYLKDSCKSKKEDNHTMKIYKELYKRNAGGYTRCLGGKRLATEHKDRQR